MARDLIPPPSPAGRPEPAGTPTHRFVELPPEPTVAQMTPEPPPEPERVDLPPSRFRNRFGFLMGGLIGVVLASTLVAVALLAWGGGTSDPREGLHAYWSKWQPADTTLTGGAEEIARKVGAEHRHPDGKQLVLVQPNAVDGLKVAVASSTPMDLIEGQAVVYELNGLGPNGSIKGGEPSPKRLQLIHREALELSLYTFRYLPDAEMVVVMLPPPPPTKEESANPLAAATATPDSNQRTALFYRPGDLKQQLQVPLGVTVPAKAPTVDTINATEAKQIDSLTLSNKFFWDIQQQQGILVLDR